MSDLLLDQFQQPSYKQTQSQKPQSTLQQQTKQQYKNDVKFHIYCQLLDKLQMTKNTMKLKLLQLFFVKYYKSGRNVYPVMRLLMPQLDRERGNYNLKQTSLARLYSDILMLPKKQADRLKHWKNPQFQPIGGPTGDFIGVLQSVLQNRTCSQPTISIIQINKYLDQLAMAHDNDGRRDILAKILQKTTVLQQRWIVKIILKDLKVGIGHQTILKNFHPDALDLYNVTSDLGEVFKQLAQGKNKSGTTARLGTDKFRLFYPIKPMLAERLPSVQIRSLLQNVQVVIQTKFDGERIQCHVKDRVVKFFSRNSHNYTHIYGPKMSNIILQNLNAKSCILDGEMVVYDFINKCYLPFGQNKTVALADEEQSRSQGKQLCYKVFDILYVQGIRGEEANLMNAILIDRKKVLLRVVNHIPHIFEAIIGVQTENVDDVFDQFNKSVSNNQEGIMVKILDSLYKPNQRSTAWLKMKGDYIDELGDTLDLVIIGGYFGEGKRAGGADWIESITVFLMGIIKSFDIENPKNSQIIPFTKVGTGYSITQLQKMRTQLRNNWKKYDPRLPPAYYGKWVPSMSERPDVYVDDPSASIVLELRAGEIQISDQYPVGYTLRFPRVMHIRNDKQWHQAFNHKDFQNLLSNFSQHRRLKRKEKKLEDVYDQALGGEGGQGKQKKKKKVIGQKKKFNPVVLPYRDTDTSNTIQISSLFQGFEFYIISLDRNNPDGITKAMLQTYIVQNGGRKVQNLLPSTTHVISSHIDFQVQNMILKHDANVYHYKWLLDCMRLKTIVDLTPRFMIYTNQSGKNYFEQNIDQYDDNYIRDLTYEGLLGVFQHMDDEQNPVQDQMLQVLHKSIKSQKAKLKAPKQRVYDGKILRVTSQKSQQQNILKPQDVMEAKYLKQLQLRKVKPLKNRTFYINISEEHWKNPLNLNLIAANAQFFGATVIYGKDVKRKVGKNYEDNIEWAVVSQIIDDGFEDSREYERVVVDKGEKYGIDILSINKINEVFDKLMADVLISQ